MKNADFLPPGEELDRMILDIVYGPDSVRPGFDPYKQFKPSTNVDDAMALLIWFAGPKLTVIEPKKLEEIGDFEKRRPPWRAEFTADLDDENCDVPEDFLVAAEGPTKADAITRALINLHYKREEEEV